MKTVAIIPIKGNSKRIKNKNIKKIYEKPLYRYLLDKISKCNFDSIYIDTDINQIKKYAKKNKINIINRKPILTKDSANGNDLLTYHAKIIKADFYFQIFVTSPFLSVKSINNCIRILKKIKGLTQFYSKKNIFLVLVQK